jgi:membrane protein implicated in regulation of membrane protease activity
MTVAPLSRDMDYPCGAGETGSPCIADLMIRRFSTSWWISLASASCVFGLLTYIVLRLTGMVDDDRLALYLLGGIGLGDVLVALSLEVTAPTRVTLGPADRRLASSKFEATAEVVSGFDGSAEGRVQVRGETWKARMADGQPATLAGGSTLNVIERDGLVLIVSPSDDQSESLDA